jgi:hypothetical protein
MKFLFLNNNNDFRERELDSFLSLKGFNWSEPNQAPIPVIYNTKVAKKIEIHFF